MNVLTIVACITVQNKKVSIAFILLLLRSFQPVLACSCYRDIVGEIPKESAQRI